MKSGIYIVATPIGNLQDITFRAIETLKAVDAVICEDTRVTNKLLDHYGIKKRYITYNDHSDEADRKKIFDELEAGKSLALVSDAGTPLISDPGYKLVKEAREKGYLISTVPGVSSVIAGLSISGLPSDNFMFIGFLPQKEEGKRKEFLKYKHLDTTLIFFDRGSRLYESLEVIKEVLGDRDIAVAREITKLFEEVKLDKASNLLGYYRDNEPKGEIVVMISNKPEEIKVSADELDAALQQLLEKYSVKDAAEIAADLYAIKKKEAYQRLLELKK